MKDRLNLVINDLIEQWLDPEIILSARNYAYSEMRQQLADRDDWICGICHERIPIWEHPDPESASVDHVIPKSLGGPDAAANLQITHLRCNQSKGKKVLA